MCVYCMHVCIPSPIIAIKQILCNNYQTIACFKESENGYAQISLPNCHFREMEIHFGDFEINLFCQESKTCPLEIFLHSGIFCHLS